ncbi:hypothetical protein JCM1840_006757 [Sporobolomyces johnsonii]
MATPSTSSAPAPPSAPAPTPTPEERALGLFARSALDLFTLWPALRLAISHGWGTAGAGETGRTHLAEDVVDLFYTTATEGPSPSSASGASASGSTSMSEGGVPVPAQDEVEETLKWVISQEFDVDLEDESERTVARDLILLWRECLRRVQAGDEGEGPMAKAFREGADKARREDGEGRFVAQRHGQGGEDDDDETTDEEDDSDDDEMVELVDASQPPQAGPSRQREEPVVDEDGFEMVTSKKKGGRR